MRHVGHRSPRQRRRRRHERGAVAIETALSSIVLMLIILVGLNFGHAMVVRHRLNSATGRAARVCSLVDRANTEACVAQQINTSLGGTAAACRPLDVATDEQDLQGVEVLRVQATCDYVGPLMSEFIARNMGDQALILRANSVMPRR